MGGGRTFHLFLCDLDLPPAEKCRRGPHPLSRFAADRQCVCLCCCSVTPPTGHPPPQAMSGEAGPRPYVNPYAKAVERQRTGLAAPPSALPATSGEARSASAAGWSSGGPTPQDFLGLCGFARNFVDGGIEPPPPQLPLLLVFPGEGGGRFSFAVISPCLTTTFPVGGHLSGGLTTYLAASADRIQQPYLHSVLFAAGPVE